jgi:hypothetical protein
MAADRHPPTVASSCEAWPKVRSSRERRKLAPPHPRGVLGGLLPALLGVGDGWRLRRRFPRRTHERDQDVLVFSDRTSRLKTSSMERDREAIRRLLEQIRQDDPESGLSFPEWLQGQIKQRGWARWRTAEALGVSQRTLSRWLAGMLTPRRRDLDRLAQVFGELPPLTPAH